MVSAVLSGSVMNDQRSLGVLKGAAFVAVSVCINLGIAFALGSVDAPLISAPTPPVLKINLRAVQAPSKPTMPVPSADPLPLPQAAALPAIETQPMAAKKMAVADVLPPAASVPRVIEADRAVPTKSPVMEPVATSKPKTEAAKTVRKPKLPEQEIAVAREAEAVEQPRENNQAERSPAASEAGSEIASVINEAKYRRQTAPVYPRRALELGQQGIVMLHAEVLPDGRPGDLKVVQSSGYRLLDISALAAVKTWEFEPTNINGAIVTSWVRVPVHFVIQ
jgi:periplasmic protein TonB